MKCQKCDKPATFHITDLTDGKPNELHLCEEHARQYLTPVATKSRRDAAGHGRRCWPSTWRSAKRPRNWPGSTSGPARCAASRFYEFRKQGRLGCPHDYVLLREGAGAAVREHPRRDASTSASGRKRSPAGTEQQTQLIRLRREMKEASTKKTTSRPRSCATRSARSKNDQKQSQIADRQPRRLKQPADVANRDKHAMELERTSTNAAANGCAAPARSPTSSSAAAFAWPATWPTFRSSAAATPSDRAEIETHAPRARSLQMQAVGRAACTSTSTSCEGIDRQFLVERQLISREHAESEGARGVAIDPHEQFSVMINEEDHLRIQVMHSGLDLNAAWEQINRLDDLIEEQVTYAFNERLGYLTACPTNVGTGMRVSVMLHLPALVITRQIEKVFRSLQKISLAVRGLYGEGSQAMGDFYQISNQITLGQSEEELVKQVGDVVPVLIDYERQARDFLIRESQENAARPRQPGLRHPAHRADDQLRRDDAPALQRADGRQPGPDRRPGDPHASTSCSSTRSRPTCKS